jgi:hypothetical protein
MGGDLNIAPISMAHDFLQPIMVIGLFLPLDETAHDCITGKQGNPRSETHLEKHLHVNRLAFCFQQLMKQYSQTETILIPAPGENMLYHPKTGQGHSEIISAQF